ncbi:hypothetical protein WN48_08329 [Eufriesea mexicana]|uniref:Uncharacterized protein n=1 Tax=Eufriesea mexicana TaxID=516756 RepID=A0A310SIA0_9HYME|nr:hypothetical protein WN48_08329 [Eufriesea mexicana]
MSARRGLCADFPLPIAYPFEAEWTGRVGAETTSGGGRSRVYAGSRRDRQVYNFVVIKIGRVAGIV